MDEVPQAESRKARKPKRKHAAGGHALWDEAIELTDDKLKNMRNGYEQRMAEEREVLRLKKEKADAAQNIQRLMHGAPTPTRLPEGRRVERGTMCSSVPW